MISSLDWILHKQRMGDERIKPDFFSFVDDKIIGLGETDRRILDYVIKNMHTVKNKSVRTLSHECYVSTTTMIRFVRKLGFSGYADFIYQLRLTDDVTPTAQMPEWVSPNSYMQHYIENISETLRAAASGGKIESLCSEIQQASQLYFVSDIFCCEAAEYAKRLFTSLGIFSSFLTQMYEIKHMITDTPQNAVLWLFSISGEDRSIIDTIERLNAASSTTIISMTALEKNTIAELSDYHFFLLPEAIRITDDAYSIAPIITILDLIGYNYRTQIHFEESENQSTAENLSDELSNYHEEVESV